MNLDLHTDMPLNEIQSVFSKTFQGLKLEFNFSGNEQLNLTGFSQPFLFTPVKKLYAGRELNDITLNGSVTLRNTEKIFEHCWNLPAQIFVHLDGYWQRSSITACNQLKDYCRVNISKASFSVSPN